MASSANTVNGSPAFVADEYGRAGDELAHLVLLLPQNVQWSGFLVSPLLTLLISETRQDTSHHSRNPAGQTRSHDREGQPRAGTKGGGAPASSIMEEASENPRPARVLQLP